MKKKRVIVWFRQDLRLSDNEALVDALRHAEEIIPVYVFDERVFKGKTKYGFPKTGKSRAQFIIESVQDLRVSLKKMRSNLIVRIGKPEEIIFHLAREVKSAWVFCNRERTEEEVKVQDALEKNLWEIGQELRFSRGKMLYYTADLPFPVTHTPDTFAHFRKEVERFIPVRVPLPKPTKDDFASLTVKVEPGEMPTVADFGHEWSGNDDRSVLNFKGGEVAGLERLQQYFWEADAVKDYKEAKNEVFGKNFSSKFSPWLAQGCLSPKTIYWELKKYEEERIKNKSTYTFFLELLWRDFFRLIGKKYGNAIFQKEGTSGRIEQEGSDNEHLLKVWVEGRTGIPFIDASMRELANTGYLSYRSRQNVANFLVYDLQVNWQMGADYFESALLDYDPCSNWGNWNYIAGVGSDTRENKYFNILKQAKKLDSKGEYVKRWCSELEELPINKIHQPDNLTEAEQAIYNFKIGIDYPKSMVNMEKWV